MTSSNSRCGNFGRLIGGQHFTRSHRGDANAKPPFELVSAVQQRAALSFIAEHLFSDEFFATSPEIRAGEALQAVGSFVDDLSIVRDEDAIRVHDGGEAMRDDQARAPGEEAFDRVLKPALRPGIALPASSATQGGRDCIARSS